MAILGVAPDEMLDTQLGPNDEQRKKLNLLAATQPKQPVGIPPAAQPTPARGIATPLGTPPNIPTRIPPNVPDTAPAGIAPDTSLGLPPTKSLYMPQPMSRGKRIASAIFAGMGAFDSPELGRQIYKQEFVDPQDRGEQNYQEAQS